MVKLSQVRDNSGPGLFSGYERGRTDPIEHDIEKTVTEEQQHTVRCARKVYFSPQ